ncbi:MAG: class I SAM-dependent methyltransferase [Arenicella sp.]
MQIAIAPEYLQWFSSIPNAVTLLNAENNTAFDKVYRVDSHAGVMTLCEPVVQGRKLKYRYHIIDIDQFLRQQTTFPASKKNLLAQAIGRKTVSVLDATGGWAGDSLLFCSQGYTVTILERHWLLQGFLAEAMGRLGRSDWVQKNAVSVPRFIPEDTLNFLQNSEQIADCIYLDPMFPHKAKSSALAKKNMQVLQELVGLDQDEECLFGLAYSKATRRVVVKRPDYAPSLGASTGVLPSQKLQGKLLRYDVYLKA